MDRNGLCVALGMALTAAVASLGVWVVCDSAVGIVRWLIDRRHAKRHGRK